MEIVLKNESHEKLVYEVKIDDIRYEVDLDKEYWEKLTAREVKPSELVRKSFEFLLEREPKESILRQFNIKEISTYFPEYESRIVA